MVRAVAGRCVSYGGTYAQDKDDVVSRDYGGRSQ